MNKLGPRKNKYFLLSLLSVIFFYLVSETQESLMDQEILDKLLSTDVATLLAVGLIGFLFVGYRAFGFIEYLLTNFITKFNEIQVSIRQSVESLTAAFRDLKEVNNATITVNEKQTGILALVAERQNNQMAKLQEIEEQLRIHYKDLDTIPAKFDLGLKPVLIRLDGIEAQQKDVKEIVEKVHHRLEKIVILPSHAEVPSEKTSSDSTDPS